MYTTETYCVIDGFVNVICMNKMRKEGILEPGDFYSTDLNEVSDLQFNKEFF